MIDKLMDYGVAFLLGLAIGVFAIGVYGYRTDNLTITYYATFENGETIKVDSIITVPIFSVEQVSKMWPEYYAETKIGVDGKEIILRSKPFLFCDNPEIVGHYAGRDVYGLLPRRRQKNE